MQLAAQRHFQRLLYVCSRSKPRWVCGLFQLLVGLSNSPAEFSSMLFPAFTNEKSSPEATVISAATRVFANCRMTLRF